MNLKQFSYVDFEDTDGIPSAVEALAPSIEEARVEIQEGRRDSPLICFPPWSF